MAACTFSIPFAGSADDVLVKAKKAVQGQGGHFSGDTSSGSFDVAVFGNEIKGSYTVSGNEMNIVIDSKPFLISCSMIEGFLKKGIGA